MKELDLNFEFGFLGGYTAEDTAYSIEFSEGLYERLREIYTETGKNELGDILDTEPLDLQLREELAVIIKEQKEALIEVQHENGDDCDPETGEEYDFSDLSIEIYIDVPVEWEET